MTTIEDPVAEASRRSGGRSVQDYFAKDKKPVPEVFRNSSPGWFGTEDLSTDRYLSREWLERENRLLWPKVWQMACHEQEIPEPGDTTVYEVGKLSFIIARTHDGEVKAYYNACQHRGTKLRVEPGRLSEFRCPFHNWTWDLDGNLTSVTADWDFPQVTAESHCLPTVQVGVWGGFVFINPDPDAVPLSEWLGPMPEQLETSRYEKRRLVARLRKVVRCNWKVAIEAFSESYHAGTTHPEYAANLADVDSQYDVLSRYVNRMISSIGVPGPAVDYDVTEQELADSFAPVGLVDADGNPLQVPEGSTAREVLAEYMVGIWQTTTGVDVSHYSEAEILDGIALQLFPNFIPWAGLGVPLIYRFLPHRDDPGLCTMEVFVLWPHPEDQPMPPTPPLRDLTESEKWADFPELTWLGPLFDQDMVNMPRVQEGMESLPRGSITLSAYQESRIRHYHQLLEEFLKG